MKPSLNILTILCLLGLSLCTHSQSIVISGRVTDKSKGESLAFVNITESGKPNGTSSDINGKFRITVQSFPVTLRFSYLGYKTFTKTFQTADDQVDIKMEKQTRELKEVTVKAGKNPADELIERVSENRRNIDPARLNGYTYTAYNRMVAAGISDSANIAEIKKREAETGKTDSSALRAARFFDSQYIFLTETVTEHKHKRPDNHKETVLATRTSGLKDPTISMLITQIQSFSFYKENFSILGINYLNPLSKGSTGKYFFEITDTSYSGSDTILVIAYRPKKGTQFEGMTGVLNINKNKYTLETAIARPAKNNSTKVSILQKYEAYGKTMFPVQLSSEISLNGLSANGYKVVLIGNNYARNIDTLPKFKMGDFAGAEIEIDVNAMKNPEKLLESYRVDSQSVKERKTYQVIDSIGKKARLDRYFTFLETFATGKLRIKIFDIDLNRLIRFNNYEGFRFGFGMETNDRLTRWAQIGGFVGYGLKDRQLKYGGFAQVNFNKKKSYALRFSYMLDVLPSGEYGFDENKAFLGREQNRNIILKHFDLIEQTNIQLKISPIPQLTLTPMFGVQNLYTRLNYRWTPDSLTDARQSFRFTEAGISIRYAHKEKYIDNGRMRIFLKSRFPVVNVRYVQGISGVLNGTYTYSSITAAVDYKVFIKNLGTSRFSLQGGYLAGRVPYFKLFNMRGNFDASSRLAGIGLVSENAFETMRVNEFAGDRFVSLFYRHNFGFLLFSYKKFKPELTLSQAIGFSWLENGGRHTGLEVKDMRKGFFESGLLIDNLLRSRFTGLGVGVFYRYGAYTLPKTIDNFGFKIALKFNL